MLSNVKKSFFLLSFFISMSLHGASKSDGAINSEITVQNDEENESSQIRFVSTFDTPPRSPSTSISPYDFDHYSPSRDGNPFNLHPPISPDTSLENLKETKNITPTSSPVQSPTGSPAQSEIKRSFDFQPPYAKDPLDLFSLATLTLQTPPQKKTEEISDEKRHKRIGKSDANHILFLNAIKLFLNAIQKGDTETVNRLIAQAQLNQAYIIEGLQQALETHHDLQITTHYQMGITFNYALETKNQRIINAFLKTPSKLVSNPGRVVYHAFFSLTHIESHDEFARKLNNALKNKQVLSYLKKSYTTVYNYKGLLEALFLRAIHTTNKKLVRKLLTSHILGGLDNTVLGAAVKIQTPHQKNIKRQIKSNNGTSKCIIC